MVAFQQVPKSDLSSASLDLEKLQDYIVALEPIYGNADGEALILALDGGETAREITRNVKQAFGVLQARNQNMHPKDGLVVKRRGAKLAVSIEANPPPKVSRPRKSKATAAAA